nr:retrovirus-related Pol polyprotein from transposon TNT 1-94 [Tanacetum cinerariifolium]
KTTAQKHLKVLQFDVKSAFLNGELDEEVYVTQPPGFEKANEKSKVYRLKKALYGLKQAPRAWYSKIDNFFRKNGFERSMNEPTLYIKNQGADNFMIISLYVDDMIYTGSSLHLISEFTKSMKKMFDMTDLGELHVITQMNPEEKLRADEGTGRVNESLYRSLIGRLIYVTHSRPDLSFTVGVLSRFMHNPSKKHFGAAKRVLRYLAGTMKLGIWFREVEDFSLKGYCDSDYGGSVDDGKSTTGNCSMLGQISSTTNVGPLTVSVTDVRGEEVVRSLCYSSSGDSVFGWRLLQIVAQKTC